MPETVIQKRAAPRSAFQPGRSPNPGGKPQLDRDFHLFLTQPFDEQRKQVDQSWLELAYVMPRKALRLALTGNKKDAGQLYQFIMSGAIAKDKRFPNSDEALTIRLPASLLQAYSVAIQVAPIPAGVSTQIVQAEAQAVPKDIV